jgi:TPR repeat protein
MGKSPNPFSSPIVTSADSRAPFTALSKWYLCGSDGNFEKNEALAVTFAEKAAARSLPSAEFALGYFREVGINGPIDLDQAKRWYQRVRREYPSSAFPPAADSARYR